MEYPRLIENTARHYLYHTLGQCHTYRVSIYSYVLNFGVFFILVLGLAAVLYYCYRGKMTDYEKEQKMYHDQQYILSKIRYYKDTASAGSKELNISTQLMEAARHGIENNTSVSSITGLPTFPSPFLE
jgi:hypothetical protein